MRLAAYQRAEPRLRERYDEAQAAAIQRDLEAEREFDEWLEAELADDPIAQAVKAERELVDLIVERDG
jgi:hypothetical protein